MLPIVTEFITNEKYASKEALESSDDSIFFAIGSIFIKYSKSLNYVLFSTIRLRLQSYQISEI